MTERPSEILHGEGKPSDVEQAGRRASPDAVPLVRPGARTTPLRASPHDKEKLMSVALRVLIVDDHTANAELVLDALRQGGFDPQWHRVETAEEYTAALRPDLDVILVDDALPDFDAPRALRLLRELGLEVPLIVLTGVVDEEPAMDCLKQGAADYLLKDRLGRLPQAVVRALEGKRLREEARRAEMARRESEERFHRLTENAQDIIYRYRLSPIRGLEYISPAVTRITGYTPEQCYAHPDLGVRMVRPNHWAVGTSVENAPAPIKPVTFRFVRKDGTAVWLEQNAVMVFGGAGEPVATEGLIRDVTEHRRTEDALRDSQQRLSVIVEASRDGIVVADDAIIVFANTALVQLYGYQSPADLVNQHVSILRVPEDKRRVLELAWGVPGDTTDPFYEFKGKRKDGTALDLEASVSVAAIAGKPHAIAVIRDITHRKHLEAQFHQAQRMEAVGQLAGGIAHDFNNILTAILGYTELLLDRCGADDPSRADLEEIRKAGETAASLTQQLLALGRRQVMQPAALDLNGVVASMEQMLRRLISEDIEVCLRLEAGLGRVKADPVQIEQVIMNLALNARDAMPGGGELTIETANVDLDEAYAQTHASVVPGPYVMLAVGDTGCGMTPDVQTRLFEPFFTTKEAGKGTGLGLSTVYGIVKQSGGSIWIYSELGQGATFKIYLPRVDELPAPIVLGTRVQDLAKGTETILLVEDNDALRTLACKMLQRYGYHVLQARDPNDASRIVKEHEGQIHLLFTDMVMPQASGRELGERLALSHPGMKVLYTSGYVNNASTCDWILKTGVAFLPKPFTGASVARKIRDVLDSQPVIDAAEISIRP